MLDVTLHATICKHIYTLVHVKTRDIVVSKDRPLVDTDYS